MMFFKKSDAVIILFFMLFSGFFSFISVSSSVFFLDGDTANIGNWALRDLYIADFQNDPVIAKDNVYYLKPHMFMIKSLMKLAGSYIAAMKMLLFFQISLTLITTFYMLRGLFRNLNKFPAAIASLFLTMVYIKVPIFECNGFIDLRNATARATFSIFIPLLLLYYFKGKDIPILKFRIPRVFIIAGAGALLAQLHPQTGITVISTIFLHWLIVRRSTITRRRILIALAGFLPFAIGIYFFLDSFAQSTFNHGALDYTFTKIYELFTSDQQFGFRFFNLNSFWLMQFTFLPYVFPALVMLFFIRTLPENEDDRKLFVFLRSLFFTAMGLHLILGFAGYHFATLSAIGIDSIFMRSTKFVLFLLELLALFYILKGRCFVKSKILYYLSSGAIIFCLFTMSGSRLDIQHETLARIFSYVPVIDESNDVKYNVIFKFPIIACLLLILVMTTLNWRKEFWKNALIAYCSAVMLLMPFASKAVKMKMGDILDSTAGLGSWTIVGKLISSSCASEFGSFEDSRKWVAENTRPGTMIFTIMKPSDGQRFKIAAIRPGVGDPEDGCIMNTGKHLRNELNDFYEKLAQSKIPETKYQLIIEKMKKYNCHVIIVHKLLFPEIISVLDGKLPLAHTNKCYNIYLEGSGETF